jgi:hypothetical protein
MEPGRDQAKEPKAPKEPRFPKGTQETENQETCGLWGPMRKDEDRGTAMDVSHVLTHQEMTLVELEDRSVIQKHDILAWSSSLKKTK